MSQAPMTVPNGAPLAVRQGINNALGALQSLHSGPSAPSDPVAFQLWADTTDGTIKQRNGSNSAWVALGTMLGDTLVRHDAAQALTASQKTQARFNLATVGYEAQTLTTAQKTQARSNVAAVGYEAQTLTAAQQTQARANVGLGYTLRAWARISSTPSIVAGSNIAAVSRPSSGATLITFGSDKPPNDNYLVLALPTSAASDGALISIRIRTEGRTVSSFYIDGKFTLGSTITDGAWPYDVLVFW